MSEEADLVDAFIDRIAEAVVRKIDERQKIDLIAEAVLQRLEDRGMSEVLEEQVETVAPAGDVLKEPPPRKEGAEDGASTAEDQHCSG